MSCSASIKMMRAFLRCSACASSDITSCSSSGRRISRTSTERIVMPQSATFSSRVLFSSRSSCSRRMATSAAPARPIASRSAVCAASSTAREKSPTSVQAAFASHTIQNRTAFTLMGTRSEVRVSSAPNVVDLILVSTRIAFCSMMGIVQYKPGPETRLNFPNRRTTTRSHC